MYKILLLFLCLSTFLSAKAQVVADEKVIAGDSVFSIDRLHDPNIALLVINTVDDEEPYCERWEAPEGFMGTSIANETKVPGRVSCFIDGACYYDSGDFVEREAGMTVKIRGNSSAQYSKKPYKIKLQAKADLLARDNDELYAHKDWLLLYTSDASMMTLIGFWVNELMGLQWTPACRFVNVVMNGKYRGLYLLTEAVERGSGRLRVNKSSGYIIEYDPYWWKETVTIESSFSPQIGYTFKYPNADEISEESMQYIRSEIVKLENSVRDGTYQQYLDVASFASWLLAHDLLGTWDCGGSNIFLTKFDNRPQSKFMMANLWDFDSIELCPNAWARVHDRNAFFYPRLFNSPDKTFAQTYIETWEEMGDSVVDQLLMRIDSLSEEPLMASLDHFRPLDDKLILEEILKNQTPVIEILQQHKAWFESRWSWMNTAVGELSRTVGIPNLSPVRRNDDALYDLAGRRVNAGYKGIAIRGGKVCFIR